MPYRICKILELESGHMLSKHPDNCRCPHGHSRQVEIVLEADDLDGNEMVCDFKAVSVALDSFLKSFDHAMCINTDDPMYATFRETYGDRVIGFEGEDPTTEVVAKYFYNAVRTALADAGREQELRYPVRESVRLKRVRVWETSRTWAEYAE